MNIFKSRKNNANKEDINLEKLEKELNNWKLPIVPRHEIYKEGIFSRSTDYTFKTIERTITLSKENETIRILLERSIEECRANYTYIHFGLVQVALKPNSKQGLDTSIFVCLRDRTLSKFENSLLAMVETNFCNGPIYFNCFPSSCVYVHDRDTLILNIKTQVETKSVPITLIYRVHYKATNGWFSKTINQTPLKNPKAH